MRVYHDKPTTSLIIYDVFIFLLNERFLYLCNRETNENELQQQLILLLVFVECV